MTNIEKRILENQEVMMLAINQMIYTQEKYAPNDMHIKLRACIDETKEVLGKKLTHFNQHHFTEI